MNNENSSNELFPENSAPDPAVQQELPPSAAHAETSEKSSAPAGAEKIITEETDIVEEVIPDIDAGGARTCGEFLKIQREKLNLSYAEV